MEHRLITGGESYLPFARSCVAKLKKLGLPYADQSYDLGDGSVSVRITPGHEFIRLEGSAGGYQFFTTGETSAEAASVPARGSSVSVRGTNGKTLKSSPVASSAIASGDTPPKWKFLTDPNAMNTSMVHKNIWQVNAATEYTYYAKDPSGKSPSGVASYPRLVSAWGADSPVASQGVMGGAFGGWGINTGWVDIMYDVMPTVFESAGSATPRWSVPDADWYRRAAFRTVSNAQHPEWGSRRFIVMADISNVFHAWPTSAPTNPELTGASPYSGQHIKTNISELYVKRQSAPFPSWVRAGVGNARDKLLTEGRLRQKQVPEYRWSFNSTCTRACAVVFEDSTPFSSELFDSTPIGPLVESIGGYVTLVLDIQLTGPNTQDFTFVASLESEAKPSDTQQAFLAVEYSWIVPGAADLDDLLAIEGEISYVTTPALIDSPGAADPSQLLDDMYIAYGRSGVGRTTADFQAGVSRIENNTYLESPPHSRLVVRNITQGTTVREFTTESLGNVAPGQAATASATLMFGQGATCLSMQRAYLLQYDLRSLSFAILQRVVAHNWSSASDGVPYLALWDFSQAQQVVVYVMNKVVETKLLDPGSPANERLALDFADGSRRGLKFPPVRSVPPAYVHGANIPDASSHLVYPNGFVLAARTPFGGAQDRAYPLPAEVTTTTEESYNLLPNAWQPVPVGGILYSRIFQQAAPGSMQDCVMTVSPTGSWAVVTEPLIYFSGCPGREASFGPPEEFLVSARPFWGATRGEVMSNANIVPYMRQGRIDTICIKMKNANPEGEVRTSHRVAFNTAFGTNLSEVDLGFRFTMTTIDTGASDSDNIFLKVSRTPVGSPPVATFAYGWFIHGVTAFPVPYIQGGVVYAELINMRIAYGHNATLSAQFRAYAGRSPYEEVSQKYPVYGGSRILY